MNVFETFTSLRLALSEEGRIGGTRYFKLATIDQGNEDAQKFVQWLEQGVFDALTKKYLATVLLEVYEVFDKSNPSSPADLNEILETQRGESTSPDGQEGSDKDITRKILEVFSFSVSYPSATSGPEFRMSRGKRGKKGKLESDEKPTRNSIKQSTSDVLVQLMKLASTLAPLPENRVVSMKLLYTSATPEDYEPPMFRAADDKSTGSNCWFENRPLQLSPGKVCTPYHEMLIHIKSTAGIKSAANDNHFLGTRSMMNVTKDTGRESGSRRGDEIEDNSESRVIDLEKEFRGTGCRKTRKADEIEDVESDVVNGVRSPTKAMAIDVRGDRPSRGGVCRPRPSNLQEKGHSEKQYALGSSIEQAAKNMQEISLENYQGSQMVTNKQINHQSGAPVKDGSGLRLASPPVLDLGPPMATPSKVPLDNPGAQVSVQSPFGKKRPPLPRKRQGSLDLAHSQATTVDPVRSARQKVSETENYIHQKAKRARRNPRQHSEQRDEDEAKKRRLTGDDNVSSCV